MKKFFISFIILVLSVSLLLVTVSADTIEDFDMVLNYSIGYTESSDSYVEINVEQENYFKAYYSHEPVANVPMDRACLLRLNSSFLKSNNSSILKPGEKFNITLRGLFLSVEVLDQLHYWDKTPDRYYFELIHPDGTTTVLNNLSWTYSSGTNSQTISASGITTKEVIRIDFHQYIRQFYITDVASVTSAGISLGDSVNPTYVSLTVQSEEAGLLEDIEDNIDNAINGKVESDKSPVDDNVNGLIGEEDKLINDTQEGRDSIATYISQAIAELTAYATAFVALNALIDGFFYLPVLGPLIIISLSMGIFAILVNLAQSASRSDKATKPKGKGK